MRADALRFQRVDEAVGLDPAVEQRVARLVDEAGRAEFFAGSPRPHGCGANCRRKCRHRAPCPAARPFERAHRLLERRLRIEAMGIEDVDIIDAQTLQALVEAGQHVFAAAPLAIGARPHVVAGLGRDHELVAERTEIAPENVAECDLRRTRRRSVIVGEVEMRDAEVERGAADRAHRVLRFVEAEIVPETQRDRRQLQSASAAAAVGHRIVAGRRRNVGHCCSQEGPALRRLGRLYPPCWTRTTAALRPV